MYELNQIDENLRSSLQVLVYDLGEYLAPGLFRLFPVDSLAAWHDLETFGKDILDEANRKEKVVEHLLL